MFLFFTNVVAESSSIFWGSKLPMLVSKSHTCTFLSFFIIIIIIFFLIKRFFKYLLFDKVCVRFLYVIFKLIFGDKTEEVHRKFMHSSNRGRCCTRNTRQHPVCSGCLFTTEKPGWKETSTLKHFKYAHIKLFVMCLVDDPVETQHS